MLLISRVKSGLGQFVFLPVRLDDLLVTPSTRLTPKARERKMTIRFNIEENFSASDLEVLGEKQLLDALFENILDNAIKYSPEESTIQINIKNIAQNVEVWIEDQGPGLDEERFEQIIKNRFQRGPSTLPGSGIGLFLANKIAGFHQSEIIYKRPGRRGSLFIVRFGKMTKTG